MPTYLGAEYQVLVVGLDGVPYAELGDVSIESITWELNGWGEAALKMSVTDPQAWSEMRPAFQTRQEVQLWRNGVLIWWGVYVAATADQDWVTFTCYGLLWYFTAKFFGPVNSNAMPHLLTNADFENPTVLTGWASSGSITCTSSTSRRRSGARALKMVTTGATGDNPYIAQGAAVPLPARTRPLTYTASAWHYRESLGIADPFKRGLVLTAFTLGGVQQDPTAFALVADDEPLGRWTRREASITLPAGYAAAVGVGLMAPANGTVYWDDVVMTYQQLTGAVEGEDWSDAYLRRLFNYGAGNTGGGAGSTNTWGAPVLKSFLNMAFTGSGLAAGSLRADLLWDHADEANIFTAMAELAARNVLDFEVTWAANGRSRTMTSYPPRKGSLKPALAAEMGRNIVGNFRYDVDGRRRASDVRVTGRGTGTVKEEGQAGGPTVADGFQRETIISPPFEIDGQALVDQATSEVARLSEPVKVPTITVAAGMYMGDAQPGGTVEPGAPITVGDTIPVRMEHGWVREAANRRVVKMTLHPETETLDLIFNEA